MRDNAPQTFHKMNSWGFRVWFQGSLLLSAIAFLAASGSGLQTSLQRPDPSTISQIAPQQWVREVIDNEIKQQTDDHTLWAYQELIQHDGKKELREICQTSIGEIQRLVAFDGRPLSVEQQHKEDQRIQQLLTKPAEVRKQQQKRIEDAEEGRRMLELFPKAFHYELAGTEDNLVIMAFNPAPSFRPSTRQQEVLRYLEGKIWINAQHKRVGRVEGHLVSDVKFLGGVLGSLDKGGSFYVRQEDVASGHWQMLDLDLEIRGRVILFKTIAVQEKRERRHFREMPADLTLQQGAELLRENAMAYDPMLARTSRDY